MMTAILFLAALGGDDKAADEALARFKTAYRNPSAPARQAAVAELSRVQHEKVMKQLAGLLTADVAVVRAEAAKGLGTFAEYKKQVSPILIASLGANAKEPDVQAAIFMALGALDEETALPSLHKAVEDKDPVVAKGALGGLGLIRHISSIDVIIDLMKKLEKFNETGSGGGGFGSFGGGNNDPNKKRAKEVIPACIKALQAITKEKWSTSKEWEIWWDRRKATFKIEN